MPSKRELLTLLWVFLFLNFIFCDVFSLYHAATLNQLLTGEVDGMEMTEEFLLAFSVVMEIGMVMVLVSRLAPKPAARWANVLVGLGLAAVQGWSLTTPGSTMHYIFFSVVEIAALVWIVAAALMWKKDEA